MMMLSPKRKYQLRAKCLKCDFEKTVETEVEPENLIAAELQLTKQAASVHMKHPDPNNFAVTEN